MLGREHVDPNRLADLPELVCGLGVEHGGTGDCLRCRRAIIVHPVAIGLRRPGIRSDTGEECQPKDDRSVSSAPLRGTTVISRLSFVRTWRSVTRGIAGAGCAHICAAAGTGQLWLKCL